MLMSGRIVKMKTMMKEKTWIKDDLYIVYTREQ